MSTSVSSNDRVTRFTADLALLAPIDVIQKHISTGMPHALSEEEYYELRRLVAREFELHPSSVIVVGSSRTGFSLRPERRLQPATSTSDIDLAIISQERFDYYWELVFKYARADSTWNKNQFLKNLFLGWIDPRFLPNVPPFDAAERWVAFFQDMMQSRMFGLRQITARLYRSWDRLEAYQESSVVACKASIRSNA